MAQNSQVKTLSTKRAARGKKKQDTLVLNHAEVLESTSDAGEQNLEIADEVVIENEPVIDAAPETPAEIVEAAVETAAPEADIEGDAIDDLLAELDAPAITNTAPVLSDATDAELHAAVGGAEAVDASIEAATVDGADDSAPTGDASDVEQPGAAGAVDPADTTDAASAAPKRTPTPRKHYTDKTERLKDRVGADLPGYTVLTLADASVDPEDLKKRMEETLVIIQAMNKKEQNRATGFIEFLAGKKSTLNEVLKRTLDVLETDGYVSMGKDGNLLKNLLAKPYSMGAARAMGGNTVGMFKDLKVLQEDPSNKGRLVANPESALLITAMSKLKAAPAAATTAP